MAFSAVISSSPHLLFVPRTRCAGLKFPVRCSSSSSAAAPAGSKSVQFDLKTYWSSLTAEINQKLDEAVFVQYPQQIYEAMRYSVLAKGAKRGPPVMCIAACELFGANRLAAFPTACALEMVCLV